jgi:DNA-binding TFAR19-related protein (PDSD5 family)
MTAYTSIQLLPQTRERLTSLKQASKETYDDVINKLLSLVPEGDEEGKYTDEFRLGLLNARLDLQHGRVHSMAEVKKRLGL